MASDDSQASGKDELQEALRTGTFDAGSVLLQRSTACCAFEQCTVVGEEEVVKTRCYQCGFAAHKECCRGFHDGYINGISLPSHCNVMCLACIETHPTVVVPAVGQPLTEADGDTMNKDFATTHKKHIRSSTPLQLCAGSDRFKSVVKGYMGDDYDDDEEEEPSKGTSIADESEWEDDMDDEEEEEEEDYVGESDSEESGKKRYVKFQVAIF